jgi:hypothetical protein
LEWEKPKNFAHRVDRRLFGLILSAEFEKFLKQGLKWIFNGLL